MAAALAAAGAAVAVALSAGGGPADPAAIPFDGRSPRVATGERMRIVATLRRPSLAERMKRERLAPPDQRAYVNSLGREVRALESALRAKQVELARPVLFARTFAGFAATIDTGDLPDVQALGMRVEPVRRFFPAAAGGGPVSGGSGRPTAFAPGRPPAGIALIDSRADGAHPDLRGRIVRGPDLLGRTGTDRREEHGTALAGVLAAELPRGERILAIRAAGLQRDPQGGPAQELATTDQVLSGIERATDPNGDGAVDDHVPVAVVALNSPYAGFEGAPEAQAARGASALGTLVVAPAGNEAAGAGRFGTVGSPGASGGALTVGALDGGRTPSVPAMSLGLATRHGRGRFDGRLLGGRLRARRADATALSGPSQANARQRGRSSGTRLLDYFGVDARPRARGKVVFVPDVAGGRPASLASAAAAASAAGAAALVVCRREEDPPLPVPAGSSRGMPVIGLFGAEARRALDLTRDGGGSAYLSGAGLRASAVAAAPGAGSSRGPTYALALKPDLVAPGTAVAPLTGGQRGFVAGTSVAAARVAARALALHRRRPRASADELAAMLVATARRRGALAAAGAGEPSLRRAGRAAALFEPRSLALPLQRAGAPWRARFRVELRNPGRRRVRLELRIRDADRGLSARAPRALELAPGQVRRLALSASGPAAREPGFLTARLVARTDDGREAALPIGVPVGPPPAAGLGGLRLLRQGGRVGGVSFVAGAVRRVGDARSAEPLASLELRLEGPGGRVVRELTPLGGAPDLLPGEYAYTLTDEELDDLDPGDYRFAAEATGVVPGARATRRSPAFAVR